MVKKKDQQQNGLNLPEFDGQKAKTAKTTVNGSGSVLRLSEPKGDEVFWITRGKIKKVAFEDLDGGLEYQTTVRVVDEVKLESGRGLELVSQARAALLAAKGEVPLPEMGEVGYTDESGVVLTPAEIEERRGSSIAEEKAAAKWFGQPEPAIDSLPTTDDLRDAGEPSDRLRAIIASRVDVPALRRLIVAEKQTHDGVGRKAIIAAIAKRIAALELGGDD